MILGAVRARWWFRFPLRRGIRLWIGDNGLLGKQVEQVHFRFEGHHRQEASQAAEEKVLDKAGIEVWGGRNPERNPRALLWSKQQTVQRAFVDTQLAPALARLRGQHASASHSANHKGFQAGFVGGVADNSAGGRAAGVWKYCRTSAVEALQERGNAGRRQDFLACQNKRAQVWNARLQRLKFLMSVKNFR